jgi:hypothetical protein
MSGIREMFTKQCKSLHVLLVVIGPRNFTWQGGTPINKFPKPMFRKHHAHFELPKVKVATIKLLHDFQGLNLKRRYFEHKSYNKHYLKRSKTLEEIFDTFDVFNNSKTSLSHTSNFQQIEELSPTHFHKLQSISFQQLKELSFQTL